MGGHVPPASLSGREFGPYDAAREWLGADWIRLTEEIEGVIARQGELLQPHEAAFYRSGKRVRPMLTLLFARMAMGDVERLSERVVAAAAAIEIGHVASLIHDDIVDRAPLRRGLPTFNASRGYEFALLMGDLQMVESARLFSAHLSGERDFALVREYLETGYDLCRGQIEELIAEKEGWNLEAIARRYYRIVDRKTGRLFAFACETGARLADATPSQVRRAHQFGVLIGRAFQIMDDVLDVLRATDAAGKQAFTDLALGRLSLPILYGLHLAPEGHPLHDFVRRERHAPEEFEAAKRWLRDCNAGLHAYNEARVMAEEAKEQLNRFPSGPARDLVAQLTEFIVAQPLET